MFRHVILRGHDLPKTQLYMLILLPWKWIDHTLGSLQGSELLLHKAINPELQGINKRRISKMSHVHICICSSFLIYANSNFLFHGQPQLCLMNHLSWLLLKIVLVLAPWFLRVSPFQGHFHLPHDLISSFSVKLH